MVTSAAMTIRRNDDFVWPHCDGLNWPHLRPIATARFALISSVDGGRRRRGFQSVELFEQIRRDQVREGVSIRELARLHGVHRRAVRQALESPLPPAKRLPSHRPAPKLVRTGR